VSTERYNNTITIANSGADKRRIKAIPKTKGGVIGFLNGCNALLV
jgi:hypothetical protein